MSEAARAFTVGSVQCQVVPHGVMAYEPESLYAGLPPYDTGPVVRALVDDRGWCLFRIIRCWSGPRPGWR